MLMSHLVVNIILSKVIQNRGNQKKNIIRFCYIDIDN